jgi:hypothetical protein
VDEQALRVRTATAARPAATRMDFMAGLSWRVPADRLVHGVTTGLMPGKGSLSS